MHPLLRIVPPPRRTVHQVAADLAAAESLSGQELLVTVRGTSMRPCLELGDQVRLVLTAAPERFRGQLLVVRDATGLLVHRLLWWDASTCVLKGDACATADAAVPWADVLGSVEGRGWRAAHRLAGALSGIQAGLVGRRVHVRIFRRLLRVALYVVGRVTRLGRGSNGL